MTRSLRRGQAEATTEPLSTDARAVLSGSIAQQLAQGVGLLVMVVIITALARQLSLTELGAYGLVATVPAYLFILQRSIANSALTTLSATVDAARRVQVFSAACVLYAGAGLTIGFLVFVVGFALANAFFEGSVEAQAEAGAIGLAIVTALGLTANVYLDALRSALLFKRSAHAELVGLAVYSISMLLLISERAPLAILITASGTLTLFSGLAALRIVRARRLPFYFRHALVTREGIGGLVPASGRLLRIEAATVIIYALDRVILGVFRSAATVGLYEAAMRTHNLFHGMGAALNVIAMPTAARLVGTGDTTRLRTLAVRGSRYSLALFVPIGVTTMVLSEPILHVWLGERFRPAAPALTILVAYWLVLGAIAVTPGFLIGIGQSRAAARWLAIAAGADVIVSLALTPFFGLAGPALGTTVAYFLAFPFLLRASLTQTRVSLKYFAREVCMPAYSLGAVLAGVLVVVRVATPLDSVIAVFATGAAALIGYWCAFYVIWLRGDERLLLREVARAAVPSRSARVAR